MKFFLCIVLAAACGTAAAWAIVERNYGRYDAYLGVIDDDGQVTAESIREVVNLAPATSFARVELPDGREHDFGVMRPDEKGEHRFRIRNAGSIPLTLRLGATSCKCTLGNLADDQLAPGAETSVAMEWVVKTNADHFSQTAELRTNDPENPAVQLLIEGHVIRGVEMTPKEWTFGDVASGEPIEMTAKVFNHLDRDIEPADVGFTSESFSDEASVEIEPFSPSPDDGIHASARQAFAITARIPPGMPQGSVRGRFRFGYRTVDEGAEGVVPEDESMYVSAPVSGRVVGVLGMIPNSRLKELRDGTYLLDLGELTQGEEAEARALVMVKGRDRGELRLQIGEVSPEGVFDVELGEPTVRATSSLYRLRLHLRPDAEPIERLGGGGKNDLGKILIEADDDSIAPMRLLLKFSVGGE